MYCLLCILIWIDKEEGSCTVYGSIFGTTTYPPTQVSLYCLQSVCLSSFISDVAASLEGSWIPRVRRSLTKGKRKKDVREWGRQKWWRTFFLFRDPHESAHLSPSLSRFVRLQGQRLPFMSFSLSLSLWSDTDAALPLSVAQEGMKKVLTLRFKKIPSENEIVRSSDVGKRKLLLPTSNVKNCGLKIGKHGYTVLTF